MNYQKELKKLLNENIVDIIIFGSFVKEGTYKDIDIALITKEKNKVDIKTKIKSIVKNSDIQVLDIESIYSPLWLTLIKEGFSVKKNKFIYEIYNVNPSVLYKYSLTKLNNVQKIQFERGLKQVLGKEGKFLTRAVVLIPLSIKNEMMEFLKKWDIYYECQEYELIPVLRKDIFL